MSIDTDKFRPNVGIMLANGLGELLWAQRYQQNGWQFPQGGIDPNEDVEQALFRELHEEIGLGAQDVNIVAVTDHWLHYHFPAEYLLRDAELKHPTHCFIGQKQKWFLLELLVDDHHINLQTQATPEFDHWRWVSYWYPLGQVVAFKRDVYRQAMTQLLTAHNRLVRNVPPQQ
jgi:putative (di)nucleoside polyphosphate hydrolase